jgi:hypothetical protein
VAQRYEKAALDVAEHIVDLRSKRRSKRTVVWRNGRVTEEIDWKQIDLKRDRYTMVIEASSLLNMTPAAREDQLDDWSKKGWITPEEARAMYDHPDLEAQNSLTTAAVKNIEATIQGLLNGEQLTPDPLQHLEFGVARVQMAYLDVSQPQRKAPEHILENMRTWIELANHILNPPTDTVLPAPGAPGVVNPSAPPGGPAMGPGLPPQIQPGQPPMGAPPSALGVPLGPDGVPLPAVATNSLGNPVR